MRETLIVDGYNIIGAWPDLRSLKVESLEAARDGLIDALKDYKAFTGREVIVVFDAHLSVGRQAEETIGGVHILYTKENETADELIERLVYEREAKKSRGHIYVATSDYVEQQVTFGEGALRISARELRIDVVAARKEIREQVEDLGPKRTLLGQRLNPEVAAFFEQLRRK
ncbi:MAG TPA: NYN domain-containing protein [Bacilli bacterium]|nr:NYN domain-containing protein [Bacilli bacterium]